MKNLIGFLFLFPICIILLLGFLGSFPYLSDLFGPKQQDLGISYTKTDVQTAWKKLGKQPIRDGFTSQEITAFVQNKTWKKNPTENLQIRIGQTGKVEVSGLFKYIRFPFYLKFSGSVKDNKPDLDIYKLQISRFFIPEKIINKVKSSIIVLFEAGLKANRRFKINSLIFTNYHLYFDGIIPDITATDN